MPTPQEDIRHAILRWEGPVPKGPYSDGYMQWLDWDPGNWVTRPDGIRINVGTNYGVTPAVLAAHRGVKPWDITRDVMKALDVEEAAEIGLVRFYKGTGLDLLPWGPATSVLVDIGWGSGPRQAILFAQRLCGTAPDGVVGPLTIASYSKWIADIGWENACNELYKVRQAFYEMLGRQNPRNFGPPQRAWRERALGFKPDSHPDGIKWWDRWRKNLPPLPIAPIHPPEPPPPVIQPPAPVSEPRPTPGIKGAGIAAVTGALQQANEQLTVAQGIQGILKYAFIALAVSGLLWAAYEWWQEFRPERVK